MTEKETLTHPRSVLNADNTIDLQKDPQNDVLMIHWIGRTRFDSPSRHRSLFYTASGFSVRFRGTWLRAVFASQTLEPAANQARLVVFLDGDRNPITGTTHVLSHSPMDLWLAENLSSDIHEVTVLKRSEALEGDVHLVSLTTDGAFLPAPSEKPFKIQYLGDSTMAGFGNLAGSVEEPKTAANSHGLLDLAYLSAYAHDAEYSIIASSGWGVSRGWNTPEGTIDRIQCLPNAFEHVAIDGTNRIRLDWGKWDLTRFSPDVIVLTLGTNDFNAPGYDAMAEPEKARLRDTFIADYLSFLGRLNGWYPGIPVILCFGIMADAWRIGDSERRVVEIARATLGMRIHALEVPPGGTEFPFGSSYHPTVGTHVRAAELLTRAITELTGHEPLRPMIDRW